VFHNCRVCQGSLFSKPLLHYGGSPKSAQGFLNKLSEIDEVVNLIIYQCSKCGLIQHNLEPVVYYKEVIRAVAFSPEMGKFRKNQLKKWISKNNLQKKNILEVGCGKGEYLKLIQQAGGEQVFGIEFSENNINIARGLGLNVERGYFDSNYVNDNNNKFNAFTIFSFLEHWPDPNEGLKILHSNLMDDAVGIVEVPNFELILSKGLYSEFTTDHIFYFDKKTLSFVLEKNGFEIISIKPIWYKYILSAEVRKKTPLDVGTFLKVQNTIKKQLNMHIKKFENKKVAIWGAGHQALAVIAMSGIAPYIKYIIDSAQFKQGKFTPATHLPIVSPDNIIVDPPDSILIMAAGYSDEVCKIIQQKFPIIKSIVILRENKLENIL
jgi:2-polyprenyl-3-methyl-5-hydroxy-6-metoxy-1,4-benzoquinol methylase